MARITVSGRYEVDINWWNLISLSAAITKDAICNTSIIGFAGVYNWTSVLACSTVATTTLEALPLANRVCARSKVVWGKFITTTIFRRIGSLPGSDLQCVSCKALWSVGMMQHIECIGAEVGMTQMVHAIDGWSPT